MLSAFYQKAYEEHDNELFLPFRKKLGVLINPVHQFSVLSRTILSQVKMAMPLGLSKMIGYTFSIKVDRMRTMQNGDMVWRYSKKLSSKVMTFIKQNISFG